MKKLITLAFALAVAFAASAQINPQAPLQRDPAIKYGQLKNGMTYYICHNEKPAERADYYLLTNVGAIEETPDQDGLAHFLEHMCLNGTKNLPGKMLIEYFQSIGASFGGNINASTGTEVTQYLLTGIPTYREGIIDTALLVMHDYAGFVTNDPAEIDAERGVIIEEWRTRRTASWRMREQLFGYLFKGSKYATTNIIGTKEGLETFQPESLVNFYTTWYHPGNQAIVVVGDIDPEVIYNKLEELFSDIPAKENATPKSYHQIPDNDEPIIGIITDPEANSTSVSLFVKSEPLPKEMYRTGIGSLNDLLEDIIETLFDERLGDIAMRPDAPFFNASIGFGKLCNTSSCFAVSASTRDGEGVSGLEAALTELERARRYGFTDSEFERAKSKILNLYERAANNVESRMTGQIVQGISEDFFSCRTMMHPQAEYEMIKSFFDMLNVSVINQTLAQLPLDKNIVVIYEAPEKEGLAKPVEADFINVINGVKSAEIENTTGEEIATELMDGSVLKGSKVRKSQDGEYGSTVWTLKNGLKVIVRPSDLRKEEVLLSLSVDGGKSLLEQDELICFDKNVASYFQIQGVADFPQTTLDKMLAGKSVRLLPFVNEISNGFEGSCSPKDIETMFQLLFLKATNPRFNEEEFAPLKNQIMAVLPNMESTPDFAFNEAFVKSAYNNPRKFNISSALMKDASAAKMEAGYKKMFSSYTDATIVIAGNVELESLQPLVEKYIGSLPVARKAIGYIDHGLEIVNGNVVNIFEQKMETPKSTVVLIYSGDAEYTLENEYITKAINYLLDLTYTATIREAEGATYGVGTANDLSLRPRQRALQLIQFDTDPDRVERMVELAMEGIESIAKNGPDADQLSKAKENFAKLISENRIHNSYWSGVLKTFYKYGIHTDDMAEAVIEGITAEKVQNFAAQILSQGNLVKIVMNPEK